MNLKLRLNIIVTLVLLVVLTIGAFAMARVLREEIRVEVASTALLALKMLDAKVLDFGLDHNMNATKFKSYQTLFRLDEIRNIRHVRVEFYDLKGELRDSNRSAETYITVSPDWFIHAMDDVSDTLPITKRDVFYRGKLIGQLVITPDPIYEIEEIWLELRMIFWLILLFFVFINIFIFIAVGMAMKPVDKIIAGLTDIEAGNLSVRLPKISLPEMAPISDKFNVMAAELEDSTNKNRLLTQQMISLQEDDKKHLARELHDEVGQHLTAINVDAKAIMRANNLDVAKESAVAISSIVKQMMEIIHQMLKRLRPGDLDELGLSVALRELVENWKAHHSDTACNLDCDETFEGVNDRTLLTIYRVVQECLTNISKHANASDVSISCRRKDKVIVLTIRDNGDGFDDSNRQQGFGLAGIRERVESLLGTLTIATAYKEGTYVEIIIPIEQGEMS